jgi:antitoxin (DNA-binding transcriptional repressor) of toxin-antitoxin stability system
MRTTVLDFANDAEEIIARVGSGETIVVDRDGLPFAEIRPVEVPANPFQDPERIALLARLFPPTPFDSGRILEEDR